MCCTTSPAAHDTSLSLPPFLQSPPCALLDSTTSRWTLAESHDSDLCFCRVLILRAWGSTHWVPRSKNINVRPDKRLSAENGSWCIINQIFSSVWNTRLTPWGRSWFLQDVNYDMLSPGAKPVFIVSLTSDEVRFYFLASWNKSQRHASYAKAIRKWPTHDHDAVLWVFSR